jgi:hypothetical protein
MDFWRLAGASCGKDSGKEPNHYTTTHFGPHIEMWAKGTCADKKTVGESFPDRIITVAVEAVGLAFADS